MTTTGSRLWEAIGFEPFSSQEDHSLVSFEGLAMPLFDSLYNFARWLTHNSNDAEDLVQETYLKALRNFASFQGGSNFRAWIFQILRNTFLSSRSRLEYRATVAIDSEENLPALPSSAADPESILIARSGSDAVRCAIEQLPLNFREVILLCDVEDASYREIAEILAIPIGTVMSRLARARESVREATFRPGNAASLNDLPCDAAARTEPLPTHTTSKRVKTDRAMKPLANNEPRIPEQFPPA